MKLSLIAACCLIVGCAHGVETGEDEPETTVVTQIPTPKPVPPIQETESTQEPERDCFVNSYWVNNCLVTKVYCEGELVRLDVKCSVGRPLFPWEYIPDPPFDSQKK